MKSRGHHALVGHKLRRARRPVGVRVERHRVGGIGSQADEERSGAYRDCEETDAYRRRTSTNASLVKAPVQRLGRGGRAGGQR